MEILGKIFKKTIRWTSAFVFVVTVFFIFLFSYYRFVEPIKNQLPDSNLLPQKNQLAACALDSSDKNIANTCYKYGEEQSKKLDLNYYDECKDKFKFQAVNACNSFIDGKRKRLVLMDQGDYMDEKTPDKCVEEIKYYYDFIIKDLKFLNKPTEGVEHAQAEEIKKCEDYNPLSRYQRGFKTPFDQMKQVVDTQKTNHSLSEEQQRQLLTNLSKIVAMTEGKSSALLVEEDLQKVTRLLDEFSVQVDEIESAENFVSCESYQDFEVLINEKMDKQSNEISEIRSGRFTSTEESLKKTTSLVRFFHYLQMFTKDVLNSGKCAKNGEHKS